VVLPAAAAAAWAASRVLTNSPTGPGRQPTLHVRFLDHQFARVSGPEADVPGTWGLRLDGAYVRMGAPLGPDLRGGIVRPYEVMEGDVPLPHQQFDRRRRERRDAPVGAEPTTTAPEGRAGAPDRRHPEEPGPWPVAAVRSPYAWPDDPQVLAARTGSRLVLDGVRVDGHVLPTWRLVPDDPSDTWVVGVHGRGSNRTELFRIADVALRRGHPVLLASYRTDHWTAGAAPRTTLGTVEWRDVEAAIAACLAGGARRVVLAGCSLGGGMSAATVRHSRLAPWVAGLVLDSPALQWARVLQHTARTRRLPAGLVGPVMHLAGLRSRIDWAALDHLAAVDEFSQPILLFHGSDDDVVPVWLSDALARARPELVALERFEGATHVTSWNHDPARYERVLTAFLAHAAG
jgi:fermentation-respiration switch protein FrsA (DUF1100 family)